MTRLVPVLAASLLLLPQAALAHPGHAEVAGFAHGLAHPLGGADHVLAMLAAGLIGAVRGGRAIWAVPAAFLGMMILGGVLGAAGIGLPFVETGIGLSIVAFGLAAGFGVGLPVAALVALVGAFAVFHGHAHGAEMPETASGLAYGAGFVAATALLHGTGLGLGHIVGRLRAAAPIAGAAVALSGVAILARLV
ncbi:HupE/UreJ family protein [Methylobacterium nodulans]|uniref:HupE/UreJ protein n=1 Tax=Methylobacterium nodulans (strain LMG 21967 / CNCM I-2342 / ORS 2060) TaxID=460265 RepID=B8IRV1_METNO|nr:HupE/UreJ family protein [Methylobacterium nodulans]ACL60651.1 HupE/UreJ protein [Methylobacterium nodulans ORS 2060]